MFLLRGVAPLGFDFVLIGHPVAPLADLPTDLAFADPLQVIRVATKLTSFDIVALVRMV